MWIIHDLSCSNGWAWAWACSLHLSLSLLFSSLILRTDFHQVCSVFNMTGFHGHHMQGLQRGDWFSLMGSRFWVTAPQALLQHLSNARPGSWQMKMFTLQHTPTHSLSLFCVFLLHDVLTSVDVRMIRESWKISKIGLFYYVNLPFLWKSVGRVWLW